MLLAVPSVALSATGSSTIALVIDILPTEAFDPGRSTITIPVEVVRIAAYGLGGALLFALSITNLFFAAAVG